MSQFVRLIDHSIIDFFVQQAEDSRYGRDQLLKDSPYLLRHRELHCLFGYIPEESADSFVVAESFCNGENVVLQTAQCGGDNLGCEAGALTFAEAEVSLAIRETMNDCIEILGEPTMGNIDKAGDKACELLNIQA